MEAIYQVRNDCAYGYNRGTRIWENVDITKPIKTLLDQYHEIEVGVSDVTDHDYTFFVQLHLSALSNFTGTLQDWFTSKAGITITTLKPGLPTLEFTNAYYQSLFWDLGIKTHICPPGVHFTQDFAIDDATDVVVEVEKESSELYNNYAMYNVDGYWVPHVYDDAGIRMPGAGNIIKRSSAVSIGCLVTKHIAKLKTIPITDDMLFRVDTSLDWTSNLLLKVGTGLTGKTVGLVIGGVLRWLKPSQIISDTTCTVSLSNLNLLKQLLMSETHFDWDAIGLGDFGSPTAVAKLRNTEILRGLLKHQSSFLVTIDTPYLEITNDYVNHTAVPGRVFFSDPEGTKTLGILTNDLGKCVDYWPIWEEGEWTLHSNELSNPNYIAFTSKWQSHHYVNDAYKHIDTYRKPYLIMQQFRARKK
ncbi:putative virion structural protein [Erwinia phage vB_EamM_Phobos]|uniref:putative virion structural protein n=1 Tax=Erwinia phage vB_EamM_Phobos TaxID=1883377 RepID=UPI00081CB4DB|nr:putative virion structural protein [Erwinia phage vB_EamM_Phobos]ANZ50363.1 putative virion structural protein [Erwinia phage vB_EamM_Phobos]